MMTSGYTNMPPRYKWVRYSQRPLKDQPEKAGCAKQTDAVQWRREPLDYPIHLP